MPSLHVRPLSRALAVCAFVLGAAAVAACGGKDPYAITASYVNVSISFVVFPLRNAPPPHAPALDLRAAAVVRPAIVYSSSSGALVPNFDVAFDVDSAGHVLLLPPKLVTSAQIIPRTGFQLSSVAYDSLGSAPGGTYKPDSTLQIAPGQTVVVQAQGTTGCSVASPFYAKLVVDRVDPSTGAIYGRATIDPNCGFKSFSSGLPTS